MASDYAKLLKVAVAGAKALVVDTHRGFAARWPHGAVDGDPAPVGADLRSIASWMRIPWFMDGPVPMSDHAFRKVLQSPFSYHRSAGRVDGLVSAVGLLGYSGVRYMDWTQLKTPPMVTPIGGGALVPNQNAFGLYCSKFPVDGLQSDGAPTPGTALDILVRTIMKYKRASATFWELRISQAFVMDQGWWDAGQDPLNRIYLTAPDSTIDDRKIVITH